MLFKNKLTKNERTNERRKNNNYILIERNMQVALKKENDHSNCNDGSDDNSEDDIRAWKNVNRTIFFVIDREDGEEEE